MQQNGKPLPGHLERGRGFQRLAWAAVTAAYSILTLIYMRPIWRVGGDALTPTLEDPLFNLYVLKWSAHQIQMGLPDLWNANLFHPTQGAFVLSDHLLGPAAQLILFLKIVPNAIAGYNFLLFTSFVGSALAVCWVFRRAGLSWTAAVLAGWMFAFSPYRISQLTHIQVLIAQWLPLTLWFWDRLLAERTLKNAGLFLLFYILHVTGGCYLAYMIHFAMLALLANRLAAQGREILSARSLKLLVPVGLLAVSVTVAIFLPYVQLSKLTGAARSDEEIRQFGARPASYLSPAREGLYSDQARAFLRATLGKEFKSFIRSENALFAGFLPTIFFFVGAFAVWRQSRRPRQERQSLLDLWGRGLALSGLICFALTFPIIYSPLMRVVPGLSGMRVSTRFYAILSLTLVYFAARGVDFLRDFLQKKLPGPKTQAALAATLAAVLAVELAPQRMKWAPLPREEDFPQVYRWIAQEPGIKALIELPIYKDARETRYMYFSTIHWKPLANGFSGYDPPSHHQLAEQIRFLPDPAGLDLMRELWISHMVVHARGPLRREGLRKWEQQFAAGPDRQVELVYRSPPSSVFRLLDAPASSSIPKRAGL